MIVDRVIAGSFVVLVGALQVFATRWFVQLQIWVQKKLMKAEYVPTSRTYQIIRAFGTILLVLGLFMVYTGLEI